MPHYPGLVFAALALAFLIVPFLELFVLISVGQTFGAWPTIATLLIVSILGAVLVKREGLAVVRRARAQVERGEVPGTEIVDGVLILFAGALLLTPGFITDLLGLSLLVAPIRRAMRAAARRWFQRRVDVKLGRGRGWIRD